MLKQCRERSIQSYKITAEKRTGGVSAQEILIRLKPVQDASRRRFCRYCGFAIRTGKHECPSCKRTSTALVGEFVEPSEAARIPVVHPPEPWNELVWPEGATVSLSSRQGVGKSSVAMVLNRTKELQIAAWFTTEQDPNQVQEIASRVHVPCPPIWPVSQMDPLNNALRGLDKVPAGPGAVIVFDSLTPLGVQGAVQMMNRLIMDAREFGWRIVMINQTNKAEQVAGSASLVFMPDIDARLTTDKFARRRLYVGKNRYGPEFTRYFGFDREGQVILPDFRGIVHSVEGLHPNLELVPYGLADGSVPGKPGQARGKKVQWAGILDPLAEYGLLPRFAGYATAGAESAATEDGLMYPPDWQERRAFAETHGNKWLSREEIATVLGATSWQPLAARLAKARAKREGTEEDDLPSFLDLPHGTEIDEEGTAP